MKVKELKKWLKKWLKNRCDEKEYGFSRELDLDCLITKIQENRTEKAAE